MEPDLAFPLPAAPWTTSTLSLVLEMLSYWSGSMVSR